MRLVAERCLYGVDFNPMAVELARVSLWLVTMAGDKPLTFLDHHLKYGNSLIGARLRDLDTLPLGKKKSGKAGADAPRLFADDDLRATFDPVVDRRRWLGTWQTETVQDAVDKATLLRSLDRDVPNWKELREVCDLWCAAWFWPDEAGLPLNAAVYHSVARYIKEPRHAMAPANVEAYRATARAVARRQRFFHWELEFPELYADERGYPLANPGFDAVIGNPPWDIVKPNSQEFFSAYDPRFRELGKQAAIARMEELRAAPEVEAAWCDYEFSRERQSLFFRDSAQYPHQTAVVDGQRTGGDINTYKVFLERFHRVLSGRGHAGIIVPSGLYTDEGCTGLRQLFFERSRVDYLYGFENRNKIFPIDSRFKFILFGFSPGHSAHAFPAAFMMHDPARLAGIEATSLHMPQDLIRRFSPGTLSLMEFRAQRDVDVISAIFDGHPLLGERVESGWNVRFTAEFHMTSDSRLFNEEGAGLRLYEGKTMHQYTAYWEEPQHWVVEAPAREELTRREVGRMKRAVLRYRDQQGMPPLGKSAVEALEARLRGGVRLAYEEYRLAYRDIARNTDYRTLISALLPRRIFAGNTLPCAVPLRFFPERALTRGPEHDDFFEFDPSPAQQLFLCGVFNSFTLDFVIRFKVSAHVNFFYLYGLPVPRLQEGDPHFDAIVARAARLTCTTPEFDDLARQVGMAPGTGATDPTERQQLKNEIDALVAHLYRLDAADLGHVLYAPYAFPLVDKAIKDGVMTELKRLSATGLAAYAASDTPAGASQPA